MLKRFSNLSMLSKFRAFLALGYRAASHRVQQLLFKGSESHLQQYDILKSMGETISEMEAVRVNAGLAYRFSHLFFDSSVSTMVRASGSDILVFKQVFIDEEYRPLVAMIEQHCDAESISSIIDAGANIGLTSIYLSRFFPSARIAMIEPDPSNFQILESNIAANSLKNVTLLKAGLWPFHSELEIDRSFRDGKDWSASLKSKSNSTNNDSKVEGMTIDRVCEAANFKVVDVLKMDIEGGERHFFNDPKIAAAMLSRIRFLALEIHDEFKIRDVIHKSLSENDFFYFEHGETTFAFNKKFI